MFHDTFGHVPLLTNQAFCDFWRNSVKIALKYIEMFPAGSGGAVVNEAALRKGT
jgi:phenylalanine-4-hydroxylase